MRGNSFRVKSAHHFTLVRWRSRRGKGTQPEVKTVTPEKHRIITSAPSSEEDGTTCASCTLREKGYRLGVRSSIFPHEFVRYARKITAFLICQRYEIYLTYGILKFPAN